MNCSTHADKIILKYRKYCNLRPVTLPKTYYSKVIFPGFWHVKNSYHHSHKKRIVWKHQNTGDDPKKTVLSLNGKSSFAGDFVLIWMKERLIWFNLLRDGTRNELPNIKETFTENLQLKMLVLCTKVWPFSKAGLSSSYDGWAK